MALVKTEYIHVRLSPSEKEKLKQKSKQARMTMSEYILALNDRKKITVIDGVPELVVEITRIGTNINQIAYQCNASRSVSDLQLKTVLQRLDDVKAILTAIIKRLYAQPNDDETEI